MKISTAILWSFSFFDFSHHFLSWIWSWTKIVFCGSASWKLPCRGTFFFLNCFTFVLWSNDVQIWLGASPGRTALLRRWLWPYLKRNSRLNSQGYLGGAQTGTALIALQWASIICTSEKGVKGTAASRYLYPCDAVRLFVHFSEVQDWRSVYLWLSSFIPGTCVTTAL